jgi:hypothetical protein
VKIVSEGGTNEGTVTERYRGIVRIVWDGKGGRWWLNHRARYDRQRARNVYVVSKFVPPPTAREVAKAFAFDF